MSINFLKARSHCLCPKWVRSIWLQNQIMMSRSGAGCDSISSQMLPSVKWDFTRSHASLTWVGLRLNDLANGWLGVVEELSGKSTVLGVVPMVSSFTCPPPCWLVAGVEGFIVIHCGRGVGVSSTKPGSNLVASEQKATGVFVFSSFDSISGVAVELVQHICGSIP